MSQRQRRRHHDSTRMPAAGTGVFLKGPAAAVPPPAPVQSDHAVATGPPTADSAGARQWRLLRAGLLLDELARVQQLREMSAGEQTEGGVPAAPADWRRLQLEEEWRRGQSVTAEGGGGGFTSLRRATRMRLESQLCGRGRAATGR